jgi:hypothetical protein
MQLTTETKPSDKNGIGSNQSLIPADKRILCSTCDYTPSCIYLKAHGGLIQYCEEYNCQKLAESVISEPIEAEDIQPDLFRGLCANCAKKEACRFPKSAEGVWHCEEYE